MKPMKQIALLVAAIIVALQFTFAQTKDEKAVLDLSRKKFEWLINKQADSLESVLDNRVMYVHSNGWTQSKKEVLADMQSGKLIYKIVEVKDASVRLYSNTAIVTGIGRFSGAREGNTFDMDLSYTEVYVLQEKRWVLASRHANRLP